MAIAKAERDLARIRSEISRLRMQLEDAERREVKIAHFIEMASIYGVGDAAGVEELEEVPRPEGSVSNTVQQTIAVLREAGQPMQTKQLVEELAKRGIHIGGANPITNLSGSLSRHKSLLRASRTDGWSLVEWEPRGPVGPPERSLEGPLPNGPTGPIPGERAEWREPKTNTARVSSGWDAPKGDLDEEIPF